MCSILFYCKVLCFPVNTGLQQSELRRQLQDAGLSIIAKHNSFVATGASLGQLVMSTAYPHFHLSNIFSTSIHRFIHTGNFSI